MENFEIIKKLGSGTFAKVYKVRRRKDNQIYALKKVQILNLSEKQKTNSLNEIRVLASIKSKYIVNYKEAFLDGMDSTLCLVMEYADKGDLSQLITKHKESNTNFKEKEIWKIFIHLVKGLKSLHDLNILHRDIKSSNIFLFSDGTAKLGDLNVCKILSKNNLGKTQAGTPCYASPEVWMEKPYGLKSDIWSLGCVLYEMVTLKCPFSSNNVVELFNKILISDFKLNKIPKEFSSDLSYIIEHMIKFEPEKRISCEQILECDFVLNNHEDSDEENISNEEQKLLETLYMPNDLLYLNNQLPKANYSQEIKNNFKSNKTLQPIKLKSNLKSLCLSQNLNKYNSDGKLFHINNDKKYSPNIKIANNLNALFNEEYINNKNTINVNKSIKGPIKLKEIKTNLSFKDDTNKLKDSSKKNISKIVSSLQLKNDLENKDKLENDFINEKEIKSYIFFHRDKWEDIIFNKKKKRSHEKAKSFKLKIKKEKNSENKNINNRYSFIENNNNYEYKQISTDVNIIENNKNKKMELSPFKLNYNINTNNKYFSSKCIDKYNYLKEKNSNIFNKKNNNNILPLLKSSFKRNFDV